MRAAERAQTALAGEGPRGTNTRDQRSPKTSLRIGDDCPTVLEGVSVAGSSGRELLCSPIVLPRSAERGRRKALWVC